MAFEGVSQKLQAVFKRLNSRGKLNESDVKEAMREIKLALLEADVNFMVVKEFVKTVTDRAVGSGVLESLTPGQQVIKIVNEEPHATHGRGTRQTRVWHRRNPLLSSWQDFQGAGKTDHVWQARRVSREALRQERVAHTPAIFTAPLRFSSCRSSAKSSTSPFTNTARKTPCSPRKRRLRRRSGSLSTLSSSIPRAACISTGT